MHVRRSLAVVAAAALGSSLAFIAPAQADHGHSKGGEGRFSIQDAVDRADPGDTIRIPKGTYRETVTIDKDGITLKGHRVVIKPPADAESTPCDVDPGSGSSGPASGICIIGEFDSNGVLTDRVRDVSVKGVAVVGAPGHGLIGIGTKNLKVTGSAFKDNGGYGAASFDTERTTFAYNKATGNQEAGFYVGDSPNAKAKVHHNYSAGNELGFFFRSASNGKAHRNVAEGNCVGMLLLAGAPKAVEDWRLRDNKVIANNKECPAIPEDGVPALSGAGIALVGAQDFRVEDNRVADNDSAATSALEGGIVVISSSAVPGLGDFDPSGEVEDNRLRDNEPADLVWDETGDVDFDDNRCATSDPEGLCD